MVGTEKEYQWLNNLPMARESVDSLLEYISNVRSENACLHFLYLTDMLSIDTIKALSITEDDIKFVVNKIFKDFDNDFIIKIFSNSTYNPKVLELFEKNGCSITIM